jgi:3-oxoacyl-[acyl-carrier-protein] synthase-1
VSHAMPSLPITGIAVSSSYGNSFSEICQRLQSGEVRLSKEHPYREWCSAPLGILHDQAANFQPSGEQDPPFLNNRYLKHCALQINELEAQTQVFERYRPQEIGLFLGTSTADTSDTLRAYFRHFESGKNELWNFLDASHLYGFLTRKLCEHFPIQGFSIVLSTACSSSANAFAEAYWALQMGTLKACIVGGFDLLGPTTLCGFDSLQILDHDLCTPFSVQRKGINLGEGGAFFVLEKEAPHTLSAIGYLAGVGGSSDAYHMTQPDPQGQGMEKSMRKALNCAGLTPTKISYINAHGTGTRANDAVEALALARVFGNTIPVSSTKGLHGHLLGGAAALEAVVSLAALEAQRTWANPIVQEMEFSDSLFHAQNSPCSVDAVLSNSFGFGGSNATLILARRALQ